MSVKNCCYKGCKNDSRYSDRDYMEGIFFLTFPKPKLNLEKCKRWISACARPAFLTLKNVTRNRYICSFHFLGGVGPTANNPDPVAYHEYCTDDTHLKCVNNIEISQVHSEELILNPEQPSLNPEEIIEDPKEPSIKSEEPINAQPRSSLEINNLSSIVHDQSLIAGESSFSVKETNLCLTFKSPTLKRPSASFITSYILNNIDTKKQLWSSSVTNTTELLRKFIENQVFTDIKELTWTISRNDDSSLNIFKVNCTHICAIEIRINLNLEFQILIYGKTLAQNHPLFDIFPKTISTLGDLLELLNYISSLALCNGTGLNSQEIKYSGKLGSENMYTKTLYSQICSGFITNLTRQRCKNCQSFRRFQLPNQKRAKLKKITASKTDSKKKRNAPRADLMSELTLKTCKIRSLKFQILKLKKQVKTLKQSLSEESSFLLAENNDENTFCTKENFLRLLFKEQLKLLKSKKKKSSKWHPDIIRWCLYLRGKSPSAYETMREILPLPAQRTLLKYASELSSHNGFTEESIKEIRSKIDIDGSDNHQNNFSLIVDEMKIKEDVIYKASNGEVVGFCHSSELEDMVKQEEN